MGQRLIFDLETNARNINSVHNLWCLVTLDPDSGEICRYAGESCHRGVGLLRSADTLIGHNILDYDLPVLEKLYDFTYSGRVIDTLMLSRLIYNGLSDKPDRYGRHDLRAWGKRLGCHKGEWTDFSQFSQGMLDYCVQDVRTTAALLDHLRKAKPSAAAVSLEIEFAALMRRVQNTGFPVDVEGIRTLKAGLERRLEKIQALLDGVFPPKIEVTNKPEWYGYQYRNDWKPLFEGIKIDEIRTFKTKTDRARWLKFHGIRKNEVDLTEGPLITKVSRFNANSPSQVVAALEDLGWQPTKINESGSVNTSEMELCNSGIPVARTIAAYRGYTKLLGFANQWLSYENNGRIHPNFVGLRAATGRSACKAPNIQQIPSMKRRLSGLRVLDKYGKKCREVFVPSPGYVLVGSDLAGIEVRLLGHRLAPFDGGKFIDLVTSGADIHQANADDIGIERSHAKTVLYASMYGAGPSKIGTQLGVRPDVAQQIIHRFTAGIKGFKQMQWSLLRELRKTGRIKLIDGRRIQVASDHKVLNYAIQGDAAILMKCWALAAVRELEDTSFRILAIVHDEMQTECLKKEKKYIKTVLPMMATAAGVNLGFKVPIAADVKCGRSWAETH